MTTKEVQINRAEPYAWLLTWLQIATRYITYDYRNGRTAARVNRLNAHLYKCAALAREYHTELTLPKLVCSLFENEQKLTGFVTWNRMETARNIRLARQAMADDLKHYGYNFNARLYK